ncbi:MAG TPA: C1 family peptidase [Niabella sp.]|nr:C1 family peptidase [Niabella sp.]HOZ95726.1 C1 family peptidase [Niabella sp.]HQW15969.1 C1 family peptidase [Niabella sp.]HQX21178.1 C1 family peptidase [Niabella sp.]HQX40731.1 C1 family peptidase [Niabella sp.]
MMTKRILLTATCFLGIAMAATIHAQDDLIQKISGNKTEGKAGFTFKRIIDLASTPIENQGSSGTCWSYSTNSFLESEMIKAGKKPMPLAKIFTARCSYVEKADNFVRMNGAVSYGDGGEPHDVVNMYAKYGILPEANYSGLINGAQKNNFNKMQTSLKSMLDEIIKNPTGTVDLSWKQKFQDTLDAYLGAVPETFEYEGKKYTPKTFAKEVVGLNPDDYVEFISQNNTPYWQKAMMMVPDNWAFQWDWNIPATEFTSIIDNALKKGYTVAWGTDVSEPYFSWPNGVAFVPQSPEQYHISLTDAQKKEFFNGPKPEPVISAEMRQVALENLRTTDDHGMHIVGLAKDQNGKEYYIVKNSWGESNDFKGFLYVTKAFVQYKTTGLMVNKKALPVHIRTKLKI